MFGGGSVVAAQDNGIAPLGTAPQAQSAAAPVAIPAPSQAAAPAQTLPHDASTL
ncbi:MAG TPA: pyruvate dehydrogenase complex dihydrolipoamide acetyltransferase, partial [Pseudomonas sp.]|nr:pyruvate dehydrogenase complex dihydrolipoamide acetyltransferase [Pseudomonas sp.]